MDDDWQYDVQYIGKIESATFGGEGLFLATLRGPGAGVAAVPLMRNIRCLDKLVDELAKGRPMDKILRKA